MKNLTKMTLISLATLTALSLGAWAECSADVDMGGHKITTTATAFADNELVSKSYVKKMFTNVDNPVENKGIVNKQYLVKMLVEARRGLISYEEGIVVDKATELWWEDTDHVANTKLLWAEAAAYCGDKGGFGSRGDWRLPTENELYSLKSNTASTPNMITTGVGFHHLALESDAYYWSSTIYSNESISIVSFYDDRVNFVSNNEEENYVRCVAGPRLLD